MENTQQFLRFLEFKLAEESYAVEILKIREVITLPALTEIPNAPPHVCGLMNLRGLILTVIDLRKKMKITENSQKEKEENAVIVFELGDRQVGAIVDSIEKVLNVSSDSIHPIPEESQHKDSVHFKGVIKTEDRLVLWVLPEIAA